MYPFDDIKNLKLYGPFFYGWGSTVSRLQPLQGGSLLFTIQFPEIPGTHFINLGSPRVHNNSTITMAVLSWNWSRLFTDFRLKKCRYFVHSWNVLDSLSMISKGWMTTRRELNSFMTNKTSCFRVAVLIFH